MRLTRRGWAALLVLLAVGALALGVGTGDRCWYSPTGVYGVCR